MINRRLSTREAAERLGVKPATLYAYVSRGLLHPERGPAGSTFDVQEVARLARSARNPGTGRPPARRERRDAGGDGPRPGADEPVFVTELSLISGGRLYYRGLDAVALSRRRSFEEVATWLWTGRWPGPEPADTSDPAGSAGGRPTAASGAGWQMPPSLAVAVDDALAPLPSPVPPLERFMAAVVAASVHDDLRHDLSPAGVPVTGRRLLAVLAAALPLSPSPAGGGPEATLAERVWRGVCRHGADRARIEVLDATLVLAADHELAPSTLAARVTASFRADPYAVVLTGLGPASGSWQAGSTGAPSEVERLLADAERHGPERAVGERLRAGQVPHGFGMPLYPDGDPRAAELLERLAAVAPADRLSVVQRVMDLARHRGFPPPNFDLGLGALSYCFGMEPGAGQAVSTLAKAAGWVAHAMEEYAAPTRFRSRADYVGPAPDTTPAD